MAVTAFCWPRRSPFIAAAAGPGLGPRPVEAAAEEAGTAGTGPRDAGGVGGWGGCKGSPAVIQRRLHVGPRRVGPRTLLPWSRPLPELSFSLRPTVVPKAPSPFLFAFGWQLSPSVRVFIHTTPFLCLVTLPPFGRLFSPPPGHFVRFLALNTLIPTAFSSFALSPLLFFLHPSSVLNHFSLSLTSLRPSTLSPL